MLLGKFEVVGAVIFSRHTGVNITFERQHRLFGIGRGKGRLPLQKTLGVELPEFFADGHQLGHLRGRQLTQVVNQQLRVLQKLRLAINSGGRGAVKIQGFSGRNYMQHK